MPSTVLLQHWKPSDRQGKPRRYVKLNHSIRLPFRCFGIVYLKSRLGTSGHSVKFILRGQEGLEQARREDCSHSLCSCLK